MHHKQDDKFLPSSVRCLLSTILFLFNTSGCGSLQLTHRSVLSYLTRAENLELTVNVLICCRQVVEHCKHGSSSNSSNRQETHYEICLPAGHKGFGFNCVFQHRLNSLPAAFSKIPGFIWASYWTHSQLH